MNRDLSLSRLRADAEEFDLLIVGGGASGLGAAVEAATRGHRVALIDRGDAVILMDADLQDPPEVIHQMVVTQFAGRFAVDVDQVGG